MRVWLHETSHASSQLPSTWLLLSRYTTTRGSTMTNRLCLLGINLRIEECTQCGASSGSSETLGESMAMTLAHVLKIFWLFPFPRFRVFQLPQFHKGVLRAGFNFTACLLLLDFCPHILAPLPTSGKQKNEV